MPDTAKPARDTTKDMIVGNVLMLVSTIFFAVDFPLIKILVPSAMDGNDITVFRVVGACVIFWIASLFVKCTPLRRSDALKVLLGGGLTLWAFVEFFNLGVAFGNPVDVSVVMTLPPVFVALIGACFMRVRVSWIEVLGLALGLAAAVVVVIGGGTGHAGKDNMFGIVFAVISCISYALYLIIMAKPLKTYSPVALLRWTFLAACVPTIILLFSFFKAPIFHHGGMETAWWSIIFIIVAPTFLSYLLINKSIKLIGSELTGLYEYFLPVLALIASLVMGVVHTVRTDQIIAMVVVVIGMALTTIGKRRASR